MPSMYLLIPTRIVAKDLKHSQDEKAVLLFWEGA